MPQGREEVRLAHAEATVEIDARTGLGRGGTAPPSPTRGLPQPRGKGF